MRFRKIVLTVGLMPAFVCLSIPGGASAQSTLSPSGDWNGNYGFSTSADKNLRLLRSDLIRRSDEVYYESLGKQTYNVTNHVTNNSTSSTEIGEQTTTTTIGAVNNATNDIDISNSDNIGLGLENSSNSTGCQNGSISIDSRPGNPGDAICN